MMNRKILSLPLIVVMAFSIFLLACPVDVPTTSTSNLAQVAIPTFSPSGGTYTETKVVSITSSTADAIIYYTVDGATPIAGTSTVYTTAISIENTTSLKAIAVKLGYQDSIVASANYIIDIPADVTSAPTVSLATGNYSDLQTATLITSTEGASIRYTLDGVTPSESEGTIYTEPISIDRTLTLKAIAYKDGNENSSLVIRSYTLKVGAPTIGPSTASHTSSVEVTLTESAQTTDSALWYTLDGSDPSIDGATSSLYTTPFTLSQSANIKVRAFKAALDPSNIVSKSYTITVAAVTMDLAGGTYTTEQLVTLSSATDGAQFRYTTDGSTPTSVLGTLYSGPITIDQTTTLKAIAFKTGLNSSSVLTRNYTLKALSPTADIAAGNYDDGVTVSLSAAEGLTIRYTINGANPTSSFGTIYSGPITLDSLGKNDLKAVAYKTGWSTSNVFSRSYTRHFPSTRNFRAQRVTDAVWYDAPSTKKGESAKAVVYVQNTQSVTETIAQEIADEFNDEIHGLLNDNFGEESDIDGNGKVIILLLDIVDGYSGSGGYVAGYFDPTHWFAKTTFANSNEADMLFMDTNPAVAASDQFYQTLAHEFQHLVNWHNTYGVDEREQDIWINEGLSTAVEYLYQGSHVDDRIDWYNADPYETIAFGNNFYVWDGYWESVAGGSDQLSNYSTVYLFFQWLRIHSSNGAGIYKDILTSSFRDYRAVTGAAGSRINANFANWSNLLSNWNIANLRNAANGYQGYLGEIATTPWVFANTGGTGQWAFSSGEGFMVATNAGTFTPAVGNGFNIRFVGIDITTGVTDTSSPYLGDYVLVYNNNPTINATDQIGKLPSIQIAPRLSLRPNLAPAALNRLPRSYPVDVQFAPGGGFSSKAAPPAIGPKSRQKSSLRSTKQAQ